MTDFKKKIEKITNSQISKGVEKSRDRKSKPWLKYFSAPIARRILSILEDEGMPQTKLAASLDVQPQQISKIVKGQENLTLETIYKLSIALNFDLITFPPYKYGQRGVFSPIIQVNIDSNSQYVNKETLKGLYSLLRAQQVSSSKSDATTKDFDMSTLIYDKQFSFS